MTADEIKDILEELHLVKPEVLAPKARKLFEAIMIIADEKDKYKKIIEKANKTIDEMINVGYSSGVSYYCRTGKESEFGIRAKIIQNILEGELE
jgi:hypothetical protein|nr:MAG TPA: hypothetical protein [Caudoviricetes sp.]